MTGYRGLQGSVVDLGGTEFGGSHDTHLDERGNVHADSTVQQAQAEDEQDPRLLVLWTGDF